MIPSASDPEALFLGTGTSTGVPLIGCTCPVCTSKDPRNQRLRSSLYLQHEGFGLLIDSSVDFRQQALRYALPRVDAVLVTHGHVDHVFGLDDIRRFNTLQHSRIPVYGNATTLQVLARVFHYFQTPALRGTYLPQVDFVELPLPRMQIGPFQVAPFGVQHGRDPTNGFRIDCAGRSLAYAPDCARFPSAALQVVQGVDTMILDALRHTPHISHMCVQESLKVLAEIGAPRSYLTHLGHDLDHATLLGELPCGIEPAYDGLRFAL